MRVEFTVVQACDVQEFAFWYRLYRHVVGNQNAVSCALFSSLLQEFRNDSAVMLAAIKEQEGTCNAS